MRMSFGEWRRGNGTARRASVVTALVVVVSLFGAQSGCSSTDAAPAPTTKAATAAPVLNGNYEWHGAGESPSGIRQISFFKQSYSMFLTCAPGEAETETAGCFDYGAFTANADGSSLSFTSAVDGKVRTFPFRFGGQETVMPVAATTADAEVVHAAAGEVEPEDELIGGDAGPLTNDGGALVYGGVPVVTNFGMDGDGGASDFGLVCSIGAPLVDTDGGADSDAQAGDQGSTDEIPGDPAYAPGPEEMGDDDDGGAVPTNGHRSGHLLDDGLVSSPATPATPATPGGNGSHVTNDSSTYDIWTHNCHNAANYAITHKVGAGTWGIISCYGNDAIKGQSGHTYNYVVNKGVATFWNWGESCTATDKKFVPPPDISSGQALACVKQFCGNQYNSPNVLHHFKGTTTAALPPGMQVEQPSVVNCVIKSQAQAQAGSDGSQAAFNSCNQCCDDYASYWSVNNKPGEGQSQSMKNNYLTHCLSHCRSTFGQN